MRILVAGLMLALSGCAALPHSADQGAPRFVLTQPTSRPSQREQLAAYWTERERAPVFLIRDENNLKPHRPNAEGGFVAPPDESDDWMNLISERDQAQRESDANQRAIKAALDNAVSH
ncbi:MAG: hypothetical protein ABUS57_03280 [Pseudomonadota bacterium]